MKNLIIILIINCFFISCSFFIKADQPDEKIIFKESKQNNICRMPVYKHINANSKSESSVKLLKNLLKENQKFSNWKFIDQVIAWSLIQIATSPHKVSPKSQFQYVLQLNGKKEYFYFFEKENKLTKNEVNDNEITKKHKIKKDIVLPFFAGLDFISKKYNGRSLLQVASFLDKNIPRQILVDSSLNKFLSANSEQIFADPLFSKKFFKSDQVLIEGESYLRVSFSALVKKYLRTKKQSVSSTNHMFEIKRKNTSTVRCNFDIGLYDNGVYLINPKIDNNNNPFSLIDHKGNSFIGISSLNTNFKALYAKHAAFSSEQNSIPASICFINNKLTSKNISLVSFKGRDPGQHLHTLINFNIDNVNNKSELITSLNYPRHLFLLSPQRIILESNKSTPSEIQSFLNSGLPLYHSQKLGDVWADVQFNQNSKREESYFITDSREGSYKLCNQ
jgi:hypothetical protein